MKFSLRNLALAGALTLAGAAMAQDAPFTVTQDWFYVGTGKTTNDYRGGTGLNGKAYMPNKTDKTLDVFTADGKIESISVPSCAINLTHDDAGNLLWHGSWPSGTGNGTTWYIMDTEGNIHQTTFNHPDGFANYSGSRTDYFGRVVGDMMSEEGALLCITPQKAADATEYKAWLVYFKNGEIQAELPMTDYPDFNGPYDFDSTTLAQPRYTFEEILDMGDDAGSAYAIRRRGAPRSLPSIMEDGDWKAIGTVAGSKSSEGFDTFVLGDQEYYVLPVGDVNYTSRFAIVDLQGKILFQSDASTEVSTAAGQGFGSIAANKVDDNTVEIYICGQTHNNTGKHYAGQWTVKVEGQGENPTPEPAPALSLAGEFNEWSTAANPMTVDETGENVVYTIELAELQGKFKPTNADWTLSYGGSSESAGYHKEGTEEWVDVTAGTAEAAWNGSSVNFNIVNKLTNVKITLTIAKEGASSLLVEGEAQVTPEPALALNLAGEFNDWNTTANAMTLDESGENPVYTIELAELQGKFKPTTEGWGTSFGGSSEAEGYHKEGADEWVDVTAGTSYAAWKGSSVNFNVVEKLVNVKVTLTIAKEGASSLLVEGEKESTPEPKVDTRAALAYDLNYTDGTVTYKATEAASNAVLTLTNVDNDTDTWTFDMGAAQKGENTYALDLNTLPQSVKYTWAIDLYSTNVAGDEPVIVFNQAELDPVNNRHGVVTFNDPESEAYGMVAVSHGRNGGFDLYNADGSHAGLFHKGMTGLTASNGSSTFRGWARNNKAVFADWSDGGAGYWVFDPLAPETTPYNMLVGTKNSDGLYTTSEGVQTAGGASCVAFYGEGENEKMYMFEEDLAPGNTIKVYDIAGAEFLTVAPSFILSTPGVSWANTNVEIVPTDKGVWVTQVRGNGAEVATPGLVFYDNDWIVFYNIGTEKLEDGTTPLVPSTSGSFALSLDGTLAAIGTYGGITVMSLEWDDETPVLTPLYNFTVPGNWHQIKFDAANNIHFVAQHAGQGGYYVAALPGENLATTPAKAENVIVNSSAVDNIAIDANAGNAVYYNVNGVRVDGNNLSNGIYIKVQGQKASKVVVK